MTKKVQQRPVGADDITGRLARLGQKIDIIIPDDDDELLDRIVDEFDRATVAAVRTGYLCLELKRRLPRGEFLPVLEARHIPHQRASEYMRIASWLVTFDGVKGNSRSGGNLKKLLNLGPKKLLELSRVDPEIIEKQTEIDLDDVAVMSVADLRKNLRKTRQKYQDSEQQKEHWKLQTQQYQHATGVATAGSEHPASVTRARSEGAALGDQAIAVIAALERQGHDLLTAPDLGATRPERVANLEAAARALYLQSAAVCHAATQSLAATRALLAEWLPAADDWEVEDQPMPLREDQVADLARWRQVHHRQMTFGATEREAGRVGRGEIKRPPGRPRKLPGADAGAAPKRRPGRPRKTT